MGMCFFSVIHVQLQEREVKSCSLLTNYNRLCSSGGRGLKWHELKQQRLNCGTVQRACITWVCFVFVNIKTRSGNVHYMPTLIQYTALHDVIAFRYLIFLLIVVLLTESNSVFSFTSTTSTGYRHPVVQ